MLLRLVVIEGPRMGEEILLRDDVIIGRAGCDLNLTDPKVSGKHAKIFENKENEIVIEDLGSSNGTYVDDIKITSQILKFGDKISIGRTIFRVEDEPSSQKGLGRGSWQDSIEEAFSESLKNLEGSQSKANLMGPFDHPVRLEFVKGLQTGTSFTFGFGPRRVGKLCPDGLLFDPQSPDVAFELIPTPGELCELRSTFKELKINERGFHEKPSKEIREKLKDGDRLSFGQTVIVIKAFKEV